MRSEIPRELWGDSTQIEMLPFAHPQDPVQFLTRPHWPLSSKANPLRVQNWGSIMRAQLGNCSWTFRTPLWKSRRKGRTARAPAEPREFMDLAGRLGDLRQSDLSLDCVSSGLKRWGLFGPPELAAVR